MQVHAASGRHVVQIDVQQPQVRTDRHLYALRVPLPVRCIERVVSVRHQPRASNLRARVVVELANQGERGTGVDVTCSLKRPAKSTVS